MTLNVPPAVEANDIYLVIFILILFAYLVILCVIGMACWDLRKQLKKSRKIKKEVLKSSSERRQEIKSFKEHIDYVQNLIMVNNVDKVHIINDGQDSSCSIHRAEDGLIKICSGTKFEKQES